MPQTLLEITVTYLECVPAYGRDYTTKVAALAAWQAGKDWVVQEVGPYYGQYINIGSDRTGLSLTLRYKRLTMVLVVK